jgi:hypothetical protein
MNLLQKTGLVGLGVIGIIILVLFLFVIGTAVTALVVALIWNWIGLCTLFGASHLTFWQVVGVAAAINLIFKSGT